MERLRNTGANEFRFLRLATPLHNGASYGYTPDPEAVLWSRSRPERDFFAGAGAGEKAPAAGCYCVA